MKAAFTKESDIFAENGVLYLDPILNLQDKKICADQMYKAWGAVLGLSREENDRALEVGFKALQAYEDDIRLQARATLDQLEREDRIGIVMLGRVYHHDPGLNHEIMEEFQKLGYPVFSQNTLPVDEDLLDLLFGDEVRAGLIKHPLDILTSGRIATRQARTTRCGLQSLRHGIRTWLRWKFRASSAGTMLLSMA